MKAVCAITHQFPINNEEYAELDKRLGKLCNWVGWKLVKRNKKPNYTDEFEDINQELLASLIIAGSYYKRQVYIEQCLIKTIESIGGDKAEKLLNDISITSEKGCLPEEAENALARMRKHPILETNKEYDFVLLILQELVDLWHNRTKHGAGRQKFGHYQELLLKKIMSKYISWYNRPRRKQMLRIDQKFIKYCKYVCWSKQKSMGKKITKEAPYRSKIVSLDHHDWMDN